MTDTVYIGLRNSKGEVRVLKDFKMEICSPPHSQAADWMIPEGRVLLAKLILSDLFKDTALADEVKEDFARVVLEPLAVTGYQNGWTLLSDTVLEFVGGHKASPVS